MLASLIAKPFSRPGWVYEEKYDGFRAIANRRGKDIHLCSRNLKDVSSDFPEIVEALAHLPGGDFALDGELVAFDGEGVSRFQLLQQHEIDNRIQPVFVVFDCLEINGEQIMAKPLSERRKAMRSVSMKMRHFHKIFSVLPHRSLAMVC